MEAIEHVVDNWMFWHDNINETPNALILGPDPAGNILEVLVEPLGDELAVFHAMKGTTEVSRTTSRMKGSP